MKELRKMSVNSGGTYITVWIRRDFIKVIDKAAKKLGLTRSELVRNAIIFYLQNVQNVYAFIGDKND